MPKYTVTDGIVMQNNKPHRPGQELVLSEEVAEALKAYVVLSDIAQPDKPLEEKTVKELKELAKAAGVSGYSTMDHAALVAALHVEL